MCVSPAVNLILGSPWNLYQGKGLTDISGHAVKDGALLGYKTCTNALILIKCTQLWGDKRQKNKNDAGIKWQNKIREKKM